MASLSAEVIVALTFSIPSLFLSALSVWLAYINNQETRRRRTAEFEIEGGPYLPNDQAHITPRRLTGHVLGIDHTDITRQLGPPLVTGRPRTTWLGLRRAVDVALRYEELALD